MQDVEVSKLAGDWYGESICVNKEKFPAGHDEQVAYEFAVKGNLIEGTLSTLPDRTLVRHIKVKKDK